VADKSSVEDKIDKLTKPVEAIAADVTGIDERLIHSPPKTKSLRSTRRSMASRATSAA
jgi:hypothetical protein